MAAIVLPPVRYISHRDTKHQHSNKEPTGTLDAVKSVGRDPPIVATAEADTVLTSAKSGNDHVLLPRSPATITQADNVGNLNNTTIGAISTDRILPDTGTSPLNGKLDDLSQAQQQSNLPADTRDAVDAFSDNDAAIDDDAPSCNSCTTQSVSTTSDKEHATLRRFIGSCFSLVRYFIFAALAAFVVVGCAVMWHTTYGTSRSIIEEFFASQPKAIVSDIYQRTLDLRSCAYAAVNETDAEEELGPFLGKGIACDAGIGLSVQELARLKRAIYSEDRKAVTTALKGISRAVNSSSTILSDRGPDIRAYNRLAFLQTLYSSRLREANRALLASFGLAKLNHTLIRIRDRADECNTGFSEAFKAYEEADHLFTNAAMALQSVVSCLQRFAADTDGMAQIPVNEERTTTLLGCFKAVAEIGGVSEEEVLKLWRSL